MPNSSRQHCTAQDYQVREQHAHNCTSRGSGLYNEALSECGAILLSCHCDNLKKSQARAMEVS